MKTKSPCSRPMIRFPSNAGCSADFCENDALAEPPEPTGVESALPEPAPDAMRSEIGSLLQRVRTLSSQFKK